MGIIVNLDVMMAKRKISLTELANQVDLTQANLSILKNNKAKAIRFSTLECGRFKRREKQLNPERGRSQCRKIQ